MDEFNSAMENDLAFSQTNTLYNFYEKELTWTENHNHNHPIRNYIHQKTDDNYIKHRTNKNK